MRMMTPSEIMQSIEGATIVSSFVEDGEEGLHLVFQDGRILIFAGDFVMSLLRTNKSKLH